jgi:hypothetical protein
MDEVVRVVEALVLTALRTCGTHEGAVGRRGR